MTRVLMVSSGLDNPIGIAWLRTLQMATGSALCVDFQAHLRTTQDFGVEASDHVLAVPPGAMDVVQARRVADILGGPPDVIFVWWGTGSLRLGDWATHAFPRARILLCVDTFPNASFLPAEVREAVYLRLASRKISGLVYPSEEMRASHLRVAPALGGLPYLACPQPLPLAMHEDSIDRLPDELTIGRSQHKRVIFTGRSDYLWTKERRMRKDAVGHFLLELVRCGTQVYVSEKFLPNRKGVLDTYPAFSNSDILRGLFSKYVGQFDAQLVTYRLANPTLRRRVRGGLSTRFSLGIASSAPIAVPSEARFAGEWLSSHPVGFMFTDAEDVRGKLNSDDGSMRATWHAQHRRWSAEGMAEEIRDLLERTSNC